MSGMPSVNFDVPKSVTPELIPSVMERSVVLQGLIEACDPKVALAQDRASCMDEQLFLRSLLRTPNRPMPEIIDILTRKLESLRISDARRLQLHDHIDRLRAVSDSSASKDIVVHEAGMSAPDDWDTKGTDVGIRPAELADDLQSRPFFDPVFLFPFKKFVADISRDVREEIEKLSMHDIVANFDTSEVTLCEQYDALIVAGVRVPDSWKLSDLEFSKVSKEVRQYLISLLRYEAYRDHLASLEPEDRIPYYLPPAPFSLASAFKYLAVEKDVSREQLEGVFLGRMATLDPDRSEDSFTIRLLHEARDLVLVDVERREAAAVAEAARQYEMSHPHRILGVAENASRREIEAAYAAAAEMLDMDRAADRSELAALQSAYNVMLHRAELREGVTRSPNLPTPVVSTATVPVAEGVLTRLARTPGRLLRGLFFGGAVAATAGAGAVALHEFADRHADPMHDVEPDVSLGEIPGSSDDVNAGNAFPETKTATPKPIEAPVEQIRLIPHGSWILKETGAMLRERGLKPTNQLTSYFGHRIEVANAEAIAAAGGANRLPDNFPLIVTPIVEEMNAMAGIVPAASESLVTDKSAPEASASVAFGSSVERVSGISPERVVPTVDSPMRVMEKGEYLGKVTHSMLRAGGLNWTTARINQLNAMVWEQNLPLFERLVQEGKMRKLKPEYIPVGVQLNFSSAAQEVQRLAAAKKPTKKGK